ncbi:MAG: hypothetical protein ABIJ84_04635 [bacterium]
MTETPRDPSIGQDPIDKTQELSGLERLQADFPNLGLELLDVSISADFDATTKGIDEIYGVTKKVQETVTNVLKWRVEMAEYLSTVENPLKKRIAEGELAGKSDEAEGQLERWLGHEVLFFRLAAALAYLKYAFGQVYKTTDEARSMLADLVGRKLLVKAEKGLIQIGYDHYILGHEFGFESEDTKDITRWVGDYSRKLMTLVKQERVAVAKEMRQQATITPDEVWDGKATGVCLFNVPAESFLKWVHGEQKEMWRGGGPLQVQVTAKHIIPISGKGGSLERQVELLKERHVRLPRYTIKWDCPPGGDGTGNEGSKRAFQRTVEGVQKFSDLNKDEAVDYVGKMRLLWHLIIRAYRVMDAEQEQSALKEEFQRLVTISPESFFGLNGSDQPADGDALLEFEGSFQVEDKPPVFSPFALARRSQEDNRSVVEILRIPPHVHNFLGGFVGKKLSEGEDFRELPGYMRRFFRAVRGRVEMANAVDQA